MIRWLRRAWDGRLQVDIDEDVEELRLRCSALLTELQRRDHDEARVEELERTLRDVLDAVVGDGREAMEPEKQHLLRRARLMLEKRR